MHSVFVCMYEDGYDDSTSHQEAVRRGGRPRGDDLFEPRHTRATPDPNPRRSGQVPRQMFIVTPESLSPFVLSAIPATVVCARSALGSQDMIRSFDNDPSAGSPTETLLRLLLPLNNLVCKY